MTSPRHIRDVIDQDARLRFLRDFGARLEAGGFTQDELIAAAHVCAAEPGSPQSELPLQGAVHDA